MAEGRQVFPTLTVAENLDIGAMLPRARAQRARNRERVLAMFPKLAERSRQPAGTLSGGEQQMLAIGRCLMGAPQLIMFDEPSLGLAPVVVRGVLDTIRELNGEGITCLLVEQNVALSLKLASRAYVLENGRVTLSGSGSELLADDRVRSAYLGIVGISPLIPAKAEDRFLRRERLGPRLRGDERSGENHNERRKRSMSTPSAATRVFSGTAERIAAAD